MLMTTVQGKAHSFQSDGKQNRENQRVTLLYTFEKITQSEYYALIVFCQQALNHVLTKFCPRRYQNMRIKTALH